MQCFCKCQNTYVNKHDHNIKFIMFQDKPREYNHRMVWFERDFQRPSSSNPPAMSRHTFHWTRLLRAPSNLALNSSREGTATASLGSLFQCLITLIVKKLFLIPNLNLPFFSLKLSPLVTTGSGKNSVPLLLVSSLFTLKGCNKVSLESSSPG